MKIKRYIAKLVVAFNLIANVSLFSGYAVSKEDLSELEFNRVASKEKKEEKSSEKGKEKKSKKESKDDDDEDKKDKSDKKKKEDKEEDNFSSLSSSILNSLSKITITDEKSFYDGINKNSEVKKIMDRFDIKVYDVYDTKQPYLYMVHKETGLKMLIKLLPRKALIAKDYESWGSNYANELVFFGSEEISSSFGHKRHLLEHLLPVKFIKAVHMKSMKDKGLHGLDVDLNASTGPEVMSFYSDAKYFDASILKILLNELKYPAVFKDKEKGKHSFEVEKKRVVDEIRNKSFSRQFTLDHTPMRKRMPNFYYFSVDESNKKEILRAVDKINMKDIEEKYDEMIHPSAAYFKFFLRNDLKTVAKFVDIVDGYCKGYKKKKVKKMTAKELHEFVLRDKEKFEKYKEYSYHYIDPVDIKDKKSLLNLEPVWSSSSVDGKDKIYKFNGGVMFYLDKILPKLTPRQREVFLLQGGSNPDMNFMNVVGREKIKQLTGYDVVRLMCLPVGYYGGYGMGFRLVLDIYGNDSRGFNKEKLKENGKKLISEFADKVMAMSDEEYFKLHEYSNSSEFEKRISKGKDSSYRIAGFEGLIDQSIYYYDEPFSPKIFDIKDGKIEYKAKDIREIALDKKARKNWSALKNNIKDDAISLEVCEYKGDIHAFDNFEYSHKLRNEGNKELREEFENESTVNIPVRIKSKYKGIKGEIARYLLVNFLTEMFWIKPVCYLNAEYDVEKDLIKGGINPVARKNIKKYFESGDFKKDFDDYLNYDASKDKDNFFNEKYTGYVANYGKNIKDEFDISKDIMHKRYERSLKRYDIADKKNAKYIEKLKKIDKADLQQKLAKNRDYLADSKIFKRRGVLGPFGSVPHKDGKQARKLIKEMKDASDNFHLNVCHKYNDAVANEKVNVASLTDKAMNCINSTIKYLQTLMDYSKKCREITEKDFEELKGIEYKDVLDILKKGLVVKSWDSMNQSSDDEQESEDKKTGKKDKSKKDKKDEVEEEESETSKKEKKTSEESKKGKKDEKETSKKDKKGKDKSKKDEVEEKKSETSKKEKKNSEKGKDEKKTEKNKT